MNSKTITAALLIAAGIIVLAYSGISFTTPGKTLSFFGMKIETTETHFIPPLAGAITLIAGIVLLAVKPRSN